MRLNDRSQHVLVCMSQLLGQTSLWLGGLVAVAWTVGFSLMARHVGAFEATGPGFTLPVEPPLIGLSMGMLGVVLAWLGQRRISSSALVGLLMSAEALALATVVLRGYFD